MIHKPSAFALAATLTVGIFHTIVSIAFMLAPEINLKVCGYMVLMPELGQYAHHFDCTLSAFIIGTVAMMSSVFALAYIFAHLYNWLAR